MAFWAYMLKCSGGRYYTGHTDDLERRVAEHQAGTYCDYTSRRLPVTLVWSDAFPSRVEALEAERIVGGWSRAKKDALIAGNWSSVSLLAKPPRERFSTSLETNGGGWESSGANAVSASNPIVSSEVERPGPTP